MSSLITSRFTRSLFLSLVLALPTQAHGFDVISIAIGALVSSSIASLTNWLTSPSKDKAEYERRHTHFKTLSKDRFLDEITIMSNTSGETERDMLRQHELYRYPNFIAAIKSACPNYADYIKNLNNEIAINYKARIVRGFKLERRGSFLTRNLRDVRSYDYYEFYELIKKLHEEVVLEEKQKLSQEKLNKDLAEIEKLIGQLSQADQQAFIEKHLKAAHG
jgi:hypothetical protein